MPTNFKDSFREVVPLKRDEVCSLKRHFLGCAREVAGLIDGLARNDPERFVWPQISTIVKHCNKFREPGKPKYKQRMVEGVLKYFREIHLISQRVERRRGGAMRSGFFVTPHDALALPEKSGCKFAGWMQVPVNFRFKNGVVWWVPNDDSELAGAVSGAVQNASGAVPGAVQNDFGCGVGCGVGCGTESPQVDANSTSSESDRIVFPEFSKSFPDANLVNLVSQPREPSLESNTENTSSEKSTAKNKPAAKILSLSTDPTHGKPSYKTVREHFGDEVSFHRISDGELDPEQNDKYGTRANWKALLECCEDVLRERGAQSYLGRKTNGDLMAEAMVLLKSRHKERAPREWLPVLKKLRASGGPSVLDSIPEAVAPYIVPRPEAEEVLSGFGACLSLYAEDLDAYKSRLIGHARLHGVPMGFRESLAFVESFIVAETLENDATLRRVSETIRVRAETSPK